MSYRSRWFEYLCYRPLLEQLFKADPTMRWEAAPKPGLTDASFRAGFWDSYNALDQEAQRARVADNDLVLTEAEPLFDAADIARCGKGLFVQLSLVTNRARPRLAAAPLPRPSRACRDVRQHAPAAHRCDVRAPRPGLVLHYSEQPTDLELATYFAVNDWEIVEAAQPTHGWKHLPALSFCSPWLAMNVINLDPKTICVEATEHNVAEQLSSLGFEVVPAPLRTVGPFGAACTARRSSSATAASRTTFRGATAASDRLAQD